MAGVKEIYKVGGAQAIAALAYGTETIKPVDKITGPGNIFVALAKREVFGDVDIDMIAGPSEIAVLADDSARPDEVAADLLSQAEHDPRACSVLVTPSRELAEAVSSEVEKQLVDLPRREIAAASIENYGTIYVTETMEEAVETVNKLAPEHLEVHNRKCHGAFRTNSSCRCYFYWTIQLRTSRRLFCWTKPRISNKRNSTVF